MEEEERDVVLKMEAVGLVKERVEKEEKDGGVDGRVVRRK